LDSGLFAGPFSFPCGEYMDPVPGHTNNLSHSEINKTSTLVLQDFSQVLVDTYQEPGIIESYQERKDHESLFVVGFRGL
jgi:hypothetical protein